MSTAINTTSCYLFREDIDDDGNFTDMICVLDSTHIIMNLSSGVSHFAIPDIGGAGTSPVTLSIPKQNVNSSLSRFGKIQINGIANVDNTIPANSIIVTPYNEGSGFFTVAYLQQGTNFVDGNLQRGDLIKVCYESPEDITEGESVRINFIPKIGAATLTEFAAPDVMSTERVYLYP